MWGKGFILLIMVMGITPHAHAAAWTLPKQVHQSIHTLSFYQTDRYFDTSGKKQPQHTFSKLEYNLYREAGINDTLTFGTNTSTQLQWQQQDAFTLELPQGTFTYAIPQHLTVTEAEFFFRNQLWKGEDALFSIQPLIKIPSVFFSEGRSGLSHSQMSAELRILGGYNFSLDEKNHFLTAEIASRYYTDSLSPSWLLDIGAGFQLTDHITLLSQLFTTFNAQGFLMESFQVRDEINYDLIKFQLSTVYQLNASYSFQLGIFKHLLGENTGDGGGILLSVWHRF